MSGKTPLNINTVLLAILVGLSGWTLKTVHELSNVAAVLMARVDQQERALAEVRTQERVNAEEIGNLRVRTATAGR